MSKLFIVMGKSATGKDTVFKKTKEIPDLNLKSVVGYTTRPIRSKETEGIEYFFVNKEQLQEFKKNNQIIEHRAYQTMHGVWDYFTLNDGQIKLEEDNYIMIGTLEAYEQIRNFYGEKMVVPIYIEVEDGLRLKRALLREEKQKTPKYAELCRRYLADEEDFKEEHLAKLSIVKRYDNKDIDICMKKLINDIKKEIQEGITT